MSRTHLLVLPWVALGGAVALAGTAQWVEPVRAPVDLGTAPTTRWNLTVTQASPVETVVPAAPASPRQARRHTPQQAQPTPVAHSRGEATARLHATGWEKLSRGSQGDTDVAGLALDTRLERLQADLHQVASMASEDGGPAALRLGRQARALLEEVAALRRGSPASGDQVERLRSNVADLLVRADLELERR